jgi:hypothetical protein
MDTRCPIIGYRSFDTAAQIQAYCEAREDRQNWRDGTADELHLHEPGMTPRWDASGVHSRAANTVRPPKRGRGA